MATDRDFEHEVLLEPYCPMCGGKCTSYVGRDIQVLSGEQAFLKRPAMYWQDYQRGLRVHKRIKAFIEHLMGRHPYYDDPVHHCALELQRILDEP